MKSNINNAENETANLRKDKYYLSMIVQAIIYQGHGDQVFREEIWSYIVHKFPHKISNNYREKHRFYVKLKKFADNGKHIVYGKSRSSYIFNLNSNFKKQLEHKIKIAKEKSLREQTDCTQLEKSQSVSQGIFGSMSLVKEVSFLILIVPIIINFLKI